MNEKYIQSLRDAIRAAHGSISRYVKTIPVKQEVDGQPPWSGNVELFDLAGHPHARHCFAWGQKDPDGRWRYITELSPPTKSAPDAVQAYLLRESQKPSP